VIEQVPVELADYRGADRLQPQVSDPREDVVLDVVPVPLERGVDIW